MCADLEDIIKNFIDTNNQFCSEKDFQFSLAWEIKSKLENTEIILECPYKGKNGKTIYIDICVTHNGKKHFIELKYKTKKETINRYNVEIDLTNQLAQDLGHYSFCKDIERLESVNQDYLGSHYAIFLTNDSSYWTIPNRKQTLDCNFRIHLGKTLEKMLDWTEQPINNKHEHWTNKYPAIQLKNKYECKWEDTENENCKYLCLKISNP